MKFGKRYDEKYDPSKNYVVMDDETLTEQQGYKTNTQIYEEFVRAGKNLAAYNLGMSYEDYLEQEDEAPFELRYELDITEQQEIVNDFKARLEEIQARNSEAQKAAEKAQAEAQKPAEKVTEENSLT